MYYNFARHQRLGYCFGVVLLLWLFASQTAQVQSVNALLLGSWIKVGLQTKDRAELPITYQAKKSYLRFSFYAKGQGFKSTDFKDKGFAMSYFLRGNTLTFGINTYTVEALDSTRLVLLEEARPGYDEPAVRYTFQREQAYQQALPAANETVVRRRNQLVYKESEKLNPELRLPESLVDFLYKNMAALHETATVSGFFVASFVVLPSGKLDTIQIHKGRNARFDRQFMKAILKTDGLWLPARLNGEAVAVEKEIRFKFFTYATMSEYDKNYRAGVKLEKQQNYEAAIPYFAACMQLNPYDID